MGIWPGAEHYARRSEYCAEYVAIMRELWATGRSDLKGTFFTMEDCRCSPLPQAPIKIIGTAQSDRGTQFAAVLRLQFLCELRDQRANALCAERQTVG
jgi:pyrimidine oxygenase